jgi:hypothetical protein
MASLTFKRGQAYGGSVLLDTTNLYEHDLIYLLWDELLAELNIKAVVHKGMLDRYIARLDELTEWVERGHTLIVLGLRPTPFTWGIGGIRTGRAMSMPRLESRSRPATG